MDDIEKLNRIFPEEKRRGRGLEFLKDQHQKAQGTRLWNARQYENGKRTPEEAARLGQGCDRVQNWSEGKLKGSDKGKQYLFGGEAASATKKLHEQDAQIRDADKKAKQAKASEERLKKQPSDKEPTISHKEAQESTHPDFKGKDSIQKYLADREAQRKAKPQQQSSGQNAPGAKQKAKGKGKDPGEDYGM